MKRLYKSTHDRVLCGVCGGIAEYFNVDPTIVRLIAAALVLGCGSGLIFYIVAAVIMKDDPCTDEDGNYKEENDDDNGGEQY